MLLIPKKDLRTHIDMLKDAKIPFEYGISNGSQYVQSKLGHYFCSENMIISKELHFIRQVKQSVIKNEIHLKIPATMTETDYNRIKYFKYSPRFIKKGILSMNNIFEVDLNQAYWETAYKLGVIDEKIYKKGLEVNKKTRLASLGSLAKKVEIFSFNGKKMQYKGQQASKLTTHLWFKICEYVGNVMDRATKVSGEDFVFYWVDGIYVIGEDAVEKIKKSFEDDGYKSKVASISRIRFDKKDSALYVVGNGRKKKKCKKEDCTPENLCRSCNSRKFPLVYNPE